MNRRARMLVLGGIMEVTTILFSGEANSQSDFALGKWEGDLGLGYDYERLQSRTDGLPEESFTDRRNNEQIHIANRGFYYFDPRLLRGDLGLTYGLFQDRSSYNGGESGQDGHLIGYDFDAGILMGKPYNGLITANHNQSITSREFGGRTQVDFASQSATVRLRQDADFLRDNGIYYFDSSLSVRHDRDQENTQVLGTTFLRDEVRNAVEFEASKGFPTADLDLDLQSSDDMSRIAPQSEMATQAGVLTYSQDFGPTLNRLWNSRVSYFNTQNSFQQTLWTVDEGLHIDHNVDLSSNYHYTFSRSESAIGTSTTQSGAVGLSKRVYMNLTNSVALEGSRSELPNGQRTTEAGEVNSSYQRGFGSERTVFARAGGRYQIDDNQLQSSQIAVVDESHGAPSPLGTGFTLGNPLVITSTIVVVDICTGAPGARSCGPTVPRITLSEGIDYELATQGDFTEIIILPTSPMAVAGDSLLVSYSYSVASNINFSTTSWWVSGGMNSRFVGFSLEHQQYDQTLLAGHDDRFLDNQRIDTAQGEVRGFWGPTEARANASYQTQESKHLASDRWQLGQLLSYRPHYNVTLMLNALETTTYYRMPERTSKTRSLRAELDRTLPSGWFTTIYAQELIEEDTEVPTQTTDTAGAQASITFRKLRFISTLTWTRDKRAVTVVTDARVNFSATRSF